MPFEAEVDAAHLCTAPLPARHAGTKEDPTVFKTYGEPDEEDFPRGTAVVDIDKGAPLELLDAPGGQPLHTFPPTEWGFPLIRLRTEGAWDLVAAGDGPYLLGWIPTRAPQKENGGELSAVVGGVVGGVLPGPFALHTQKRANLLKPGYGRIVGPPKGAWSYLIAAVDDDVTVEGWVETAKLGPLVPTEK